MSKPQRVGDLEITQDMEFQKKEWTIQRIGWVIGLLVLIAALLGLIGPGLLSNHTVEDGAFQVQTTRFNRYKAPLDLKVQLDPAGVSEGKVVLRVDRDYLDQFQIDHILPQPDSASFVGDQVVYEFQVDEANQPLVVNFELTSDEFGVMSGNLGQENTDHQVEVNHLIYP